MISSPPTCLSNSEYSPVAEVVILGLLTPDFRGSCWVTRKIIKFKLMSGIVSQGKSQSVFKSLLFKGRYSTKGKAIKVNRCPY